MIQVIDLSFSYREQFPLFQNFNLSLGRQRYGLIGLNASGKSTLLGLIAAHLAPMGGKIIVQTESLTFVPQNLDPNQLRLSLAFKLLKAGRSIAQSEDASHEDWAAIEGRWEAYAAIEEQLRQWKIHTLSFEHATLSPGTWQRLALALALADPLQFLLLDEPTNHLDGEGRCLLLQQLAQHSGGVLAASHDRTFLESMDAIVELKSGEAQLYGGPYSFYRQCKLAEDAARTAAWQAAGQELKKAERLAQRTAERQQKRSSRAHQNRDKLGLPPIVIGMMKRNAEKTSGKLKAKHEAIVGELRTDLQEKAMRRPQVAAIHIDLSARKREGHHPILSFEALNFRYGNDGPGLWPQKMFGQLFPGEHAVIAGPNGSGKSTLLRLLMGALEPGEGRVQRRFRQAARLDQNQETLQLERTLLEIWRDPIYLKDEGLRRTIAARLGLKADEATRPLADLSGGQRLRAALALLATQCEPPDIIFLDEPNNHLDIGALESLVLALQSLQSSLVIISHDESFLAELGIDVVWKLEPDRD